MKCPRCDGAIPDGSQISPCCGIWLYVNGPVPAGSVLDDSHLVTEDLVGRFTTHDEKHVASESEDTIYRSGVAQQIRAVAGDVDIVRRAHNISAAWTADSVRKLTYAIGGLIVTNVVTLTLALLGVHI